MNTAIGVRESIAHPAGQGLITNYSIKVRSIDLRVR